MKHLLSLTLWFCLFLGSVSCSETSYYNSADARADLEAALSRYHEGKSIDYDNNLRQTADFFDQHDMDEELITLLLLEANIYNDCARKDDSRQRLLYAASIAERNGNDSLKTQVYAELQALFPSDTSMLRLAIQTQQHCLSHRLQRDQGYQLSDLFHWLILVLLLLGIYISHQSLQIRMQNAKITALRLELQNRDNTEQEGLSHLREDAAVLRFRTAFAERHTITPADWAALHEAYTHHYPKFEQRLRELHSLSEVEWQVCMLLRLGFPLSDIATFTLRTQATISTVRSRLYSKFFLTKGSATDWDNFILSL